VHAFCVTLAHAFLLNDLRILDYRMLLYLDCNELVGRFVASSIDFAKGSFPKDLEEFVIVVRSGGDHVTIVESLQ